MLSAFLHPDIPLRLPLDVERKEFMLDKYIGDVIDPLSWLPINNLKVYGPHEELAEAASRVGSILYPGYGVIAPWVRVSSKRAVPHLGLAVGSDVKLTRVGTVIDGTLVPLDRHGFANINFTSQTEYWSHTSSMRRIIQRSRDGVALTEIEPGDVVILLPLMYSGAFDVLEGPTGRIPAGFLHANIADSILRDDWLKSYSSVPYATLIIAVMASNLVGGISGAVGFWPLFLAALTFGIGGSLVAFAYFNLALPWLFLSVPFFGASLTMYARSVYALHERTRRLKDALTGLMPRHKLNDLIRGKYKLSREPCERVVTVMFLDIANFSVASQERTPKDVFMQLKEIMNRVSATIHKYGGTVDRTLGDGLLCFFGYCYDGVASDSHADSAINCAREIQRDNVLKCIEDGGKAAPILPFRIGINTTSAFIGDMGNLDRIDFTLIGNGVNQAQRLESACDHHSIVVSLTTFDLATEWHGSSNGICRRKIKIKHHENLVDCVDIDPLHNMSEQRITAAKLLRARLSLDRRDQRWPVGDGVTVSLTTKYGTARLVDFSRSGLCVVLPTFLARGVQLGVQIDTQDTVLAAELRDEGLLKFNGEIRWGRPRETEYLHGLQFLDINETQLDAFLDTMRRHCTGYIEPINDMQNDKMKSKQKIA